MSAPAVSAPTVSAIVVVRDGARHIARALASIAAQTRPVDEIVVVDGGSRDATCAIARGFAGVRIVAQSGEGLAAARNQGIAAARGDLVAFLDHDDAWTPDKLACQLPLLAGLPPPAAAIARLRFAAADDARAADRARAARLAAGRVGHTPGTLLAHRALFARVGGFDPGLGPGADMDWFARAADAGVAFALAPEVLLIKQLRPGSLSADRAANRRAAFAAIGRSLARRRADGG